MEVRKTEVSDINQNKKFIVRFTLTRLIIFSVAMVFAGAALAFMLVGAANGTLTVPFAKKSSEFSIQPGSTPPWGEFATADIQLEQPEEYLAYELQNIKEPRWVFENKSPEQTRQLLNDCGVPAKQIERALSSAMVAYVSGNTTVKTDNELVFSLTPENRTKLYRELAKSGAQNHYMKFPFTYPGKTFEACLEDSVMPDYARSLVKKLLYQRGDAMCLSDYEILMGHLKNDADKLNLLRALSRQSAVMVRLRVHPGTDVDKILGYWSKGADIKSVRPLLESMTRIQDGSTVSLLYLLPQFARQRLYTFPSPANVGDPIMDCHWSTMNFFNETPDNRFTVPSHTVSFLKTNCFQIGKATSYGDIVLFLDDNGNAIHSAIYIADDIVFTKNGNNFAQPWMLMRLKDLTARYEMDSPAKLLVYRQKNS